MWHAVLMNHDLFFTLSIWKLSSPYQGAITVGFAYFDDIDASSSFLGLWTEHQLRGYEHNL